ncbi:MAG: AraC family transcriptional regulator [Lentisphaerae bacterium]|nr:MAG: AraC family transcriptional regulator [Lentisphaerota bacterium]
MGGGSMNRRDIVFLHARNVPVCPGPRPLPQGRRFADYWAVQYSRSGGIELFCDDRRWILEGSWLWVTFPGPLFLYRPAPGYRSWHHRYVAFKGALVTQWASEGLLPREPVCMNDRPDLSDLFDEIIALTMDSGRLSHRWALNLLERILLEIAVKRQVQPSPPAWLEKVFQELDRIDFFHPDYEALAGRLGMALSTLRRRFRQTTGATLHEYLLNRRLAEARYLLLETNLSIQEIAGRLGYRDVYFFCRQFKAMTGSPPLAYRRNHCR